MKKSLFILLFLLLSMFAFSCKKEEKYTVTINYNGEQVVKELSKGDVLDIKTIDEGYLFTGLYTDNQYNNQITDLTITSDMVIYAKVIMMGEQYKITYELDGGEFTSSRPNKYNVGEVTKLTNPVKKPYYDFVGWEYNGTTITQISDTMYGDITLKALWKDAAEYYTITYVLGNGTVDEELVTTIRQGDSYTLPEATPTVDDCFYGWYSENTFENQITEINETNYKNYTLYAKYGERDAAHTYISFLGDSLTAYSTCIPSGFETYYPKFDVTSVEDMWWHIAMTKLGYNLLMNNSYSGSKVGGKDASACINQSRIDYLRTDKRQPDIVVVFIGSNDWAAAGISTLSSDADKFKTNYLTMLDNIYNTCGEDVEIFLCLMQTNLYAKGFQTMREAFNAKIIEIAGEKNLPLIDMRTAITDENVAQCMTGDEQIHPNAYGMELMGECVYQAISNYYKK